MFTFQSAIVSDLLKPYIAARFILHSQHYRPIFDLILQNLTASKETTQVVHVYIVG